MHFPLTQDGTTPLCIVSHNGHNGIVNILIRNGADVNLPWKVHVCYRESVDSLYRDSTDTASHIILLKASIPSNA